MKIAVCDDDVARNYREALTNNGNNEVVIFNNFYSLLDYLSCNTVSLLVIDASRKDATLVDTFYILHTIKIVKLYKKPNKIIATSSSMNVASFIEADCIICRPFLECHFMDTVNKLLYTKPNILQIQSNTSNAVVELGLPKDVSGHNFYRDAAILVKEDPLGIYLKNKVIISYLAFRYLMSPNQVKTIMENAYIEAKKNRESTLKDKKFSFKYFILFIKKTFKKIFLKK